MLKRQCNQVCFSASWTSSKNTLTSIPLKCEMRELQIINSFYSNGFFDLKDFILTGQIENVSYFCLLKLLKKVPIKQILRYSNLDTRITQIVSKYADELEKRVINVAILVGAVAQTDLIKNPRAASPLFYLMNQNTATQNIISPKRTKSATNSIKQTDYTHIFRHLSITECCLFQNIACIRETLEIVQRGFDKSLAEINFGQCLLAVNCKQFSNFINSNNITKLEINDCTIKDPQLISDHFFQSNQQLKEFNLENCKEVFDNLTDDTLHNWSVNESWPVKLLLSNVSSKITYKGISRLMDAFHSLNFFQFNMQNEKESSIEKKLFWDFGSINCRMDQLLDTFECYNKYIKYIHKSSNTVAFIYTFTNVTLNIVWKVTLP
uniref:Uncharacterized protein n=1 Tax=Rhabditophanes sp. KR3021 TaxID=114890 RepID=A0AC35TZ25_9BILA